MGTNWKGSLFKLRQRLDRHIQVHIIDDFVKQEEHDPQFNIKKLSQIKFSPSDAIIIANRFIRPNSLAKSGAQIFVYVADRPDLEIGALQNRSQDIGYINSNLCDELSIQLLNDVVALRSIENISEAFSGLHKTLSKTEGYGAQYIEGLPNNDVQLGCILDCGFFDGSSSIDLTKNHKYKVVYGFDAVIRPFKRSCFDLNLRYFNYALSDYSGVGRFIIADDKHTEGVLTRQNSLKVNNNNITYDQTVHVMKLDDLFFDTGLPQNSIIKTDLEGSDFPCIDGASEIIANHCPLLMVSIYHSTNDLTSRTADLISRLKGYKFFIRHYSTNHNETVLYCVPRWALDSGCFKE